MKLVWEMLLGLLQISWYCKWVQSIALAGFVRKKTKQNTGPLTSHGVLKANKAKETCKCKIRTNNLTFQQGTGCSSLEVRRCLEFKYDSAFLVKGGFDIQTQRVHSTWSSRWGSGWSHYGTSRSCTCCGCQWRGRTHGCWWVGGKATACVVRGINLS